ncbi:glycoside hydrolase family 3 N-terminal domain-containing protein [Polaribacter sp. Hel1_85]|uniref:glycoside hydrolase family 3 N-terminal domain-containing protein n=1 Tax=Polaribacter sp. Hel1_85 TaxID=1250005 RepID=UPI00052D9B33|nr:glycoside hydrolase family 3 N-terminal domain-containing protein [Polaribacter sp. Hel1_85]KGL63466.1 beta-hexosaminidase, GH3 family [Polaribacter sp. Hel1_85]
MIKLILKVLFIVNICLTVNAQSHKLQDFYNYDPAIEHRVDEIFHSLNDTTRVAQMIVTSAGELGKPENVVLQLAREHKIGGIVFLKGTKENHKRMIDSLNAINNTRNHLPLLYSIDAEPSLFNGRLQGTNPLMNTIDIKTVKQSDSIAKIINNHLLEVGFRQNFAPVADISPQNEAIKNRSFGNDKEKVIALSKQFIQTTQEQGIIATAKHFPGHGLVKGDTHKKSVYIDGTLQELDVYPPLIEAGVLSIMMAHITIVNNATYTTNGLPASCSRNIVTGLLKNQLGFKGLIITDALNIMKAVTIIDNAPLLASKAGNDMLLMPIDETEAIHSILAEMEKDSIYKQQVYQSIKKIIRLKLFLGLIE